MALDANSIYCSLRCLVCLSLYVSAFAYMLVCACIHVCTLVIMSACVRHNVGYIRPTCIHITGLINDIQSAATVGDIIEYESPRQRLSDTYIGIIIGTLAAFIVLMIVVGILVMLQYRKHKYRTGTFSKCIYTADLEDFDLGVITMSTLSNQKIFNCNTARSSAMTVPIGEVTASEKELATYETSDTLNRRMSHANHNNNKSARRKPEKSHSMPLTSMYFWSI